LHYKPKNETEEHKPEEFKIVSSAQFSYTDPIDNSYSPNQGHIVEFDGGSRVIFRLSGTGSSGATVRVYFEKYTKIEKEEYKEYELETEKGLKGLIEAVIEASKLKTQLGRDGPTVITVSIFFIFVFRERK
jgi:phosphoglucomutase